MKVLVINGSPRKERGATGGVLSLFVEGMKDAGAEVDVIYSKGLDIEDCRGCFNCWDQTPGKCVQKDDMTEVLDKLADSDLLILATPVYVDGMTGSLKTLLDRSIPLLHGAFVLRDDHCRHERREHVKAGQIALVSVSGFTEMDNFDPLITHVKALSKNMDRTFIGSLLRPNGWILRPAEAQGAPLNDIYNAIKEAGQQIITDGKMKQETLTVAAKDIIPRDQVIEIMQGQYSD